MKTKARYIVVTLLLSLTVAGQMETASAQTEQRPVRVALIDFYGYAGLDVDKLRAALPIHEGETFPSLWELVTRRPQIDEAVLRVTGRPVTDVANVSPGEDVEFVFIGLSGGAVKSVPYNSTPTGAARLSADALEIYRQMGVAFLSALQKGHADEDDSKGYWLSPGDPELRAGQLAMRAYAVRHEDEIRRVLRESADKEQRQVAAFLRGYTKQSGQQIADLVWASHDPDEGVRNNATRALIVLARSDPKVAARIPAAGFIGMLNSGKWTDRNKAGELLVALSRWRDRKLLDELRGRALEALLEMARWRASHAQAARILLGRIGGIEEERLQKLSKSNEQVDIILEAIGRRQ